VNHISVIPDNHWLLCIFSFIYLGHAKTAMAYNEHPFLTDIKVTDPTPMPDNVPKVDEVGATSAPLKSASFFIGGFCKDYNEDFMLCKNENNDPAHCLKEGRKVTRCAIDL